MVATKPCIK